MKLTTRAGVRRIEHVFSYKPGIQLYFGYGAVVVWAHDGAAWQLCLRVMGRSERLEWRGSGEFRSNFNFIFSSVLC